jgi:hypothetical protein
MLATTTNSLMRFGVLKLITKGLFLLPPLLFSLLLIGCNKANEQTSPQVADKDSVGCLITNDFYAVHFSAYLKPSSGEQTDREALLTPYCQELPSPGKVFFAADLIDRDIRKTPIGIQVVELEKSEADDAKAENFKEIRIINTIEAKVYPSGVVEAQAELTKNGYYAINLLIGGEEALSDDDKLKIQFHVGGNPNGLSTELLALIGGGVAVFLLVIIFVFYRFRKKQKHLKTNIKNPPQ